MMTSKVKRRLTTILCADVQGYTRLMQADESGTLANLRRCREAMGSLVERHDGRIVNTWGDAVIAEFASVVEAVQCAVEIQQELSAQNGDRSEEQRMRYRIGINLGDVMVDGGDIYGDGVNIAARLQELAEPGGVLVSGPVYDQVHNKLPVGFDCLGQQQVKNVAGPVASYRVIMGGRSGERASGPAPARSIRNAGSGGLRTVPRRRGLAAVLDWYRALPWTSAALVALSIFLFLINVFTGLDPIWFHWPVTPMLLIVALREVLRRPPPEGMR
ncbi:MAG TPA: adenylate/guanylate cyclase domain-containing protein [Microvirga sp.]|jgi:adenylate cyclase|nr:adenylate/guanylate cyclase domain-containing protein [Microvirga sp.]